MSESEHILICDTCDERLGYKDYYSKGHRQKHHNHMSYNIVLKPIMILIKRSFVDTNKPY